MQESLIQLLQSLPVACIIGKARWLDFWRESAQETCAPTKSASLRLWPDRPGTVLISIAFLIFFLKRSTLPEHDCHFLSAYLVNWLGHDGWLSLFLLLLNLLAGHFSGLFGAAKRKEETRLTTSQTRHTSKSKG